MPAFDRHYSDAQREAAIFNRHGRGLTYQAISDLAGAGELRTQQGDVLEPFKMPVSTIQSLARRALDKQHGRAQNAIADLPHNDAMEQLRRRAMTVAHYMLEAEEKKKAETIEPERMRQIMRVLLEAKRLGPTGDRAASHGTRDEDGKRGPRTTGGLAGALLKDHRNAQGETEADVTAQHHTDRGEASGNGALPPTQTDTERDALPGAQPSEQDALLLG